MSAPSQTRTSSGLGRPSPILILCVGVLVLGTACPADYSNEEPPSLTDAPSVDAERDTLLFERQLRWWSPPIAQRVRLYRRDDGSLLLLRDRWSGIATYGWAEAELDAAGDQRLADALATADPTLLEPAPGNFACTYAETLTAVVYFDDEPFEYLSTCPPEGLADLATFYEEVVELMLDCPLDPSWYDGEVPLEQTDCEQAG